MTEPDLRGTPQTTYRCWIIRIAIRIPPIGGEATTLPVSAFVTTITLSQARKQTVVLQVNRKSGRTFAGSKWP